MPSLRLLFATMALAVLAACTAPTPYRPVTPKSDFGYADTRLDDSTWRVSVAGNSQTPRDLVENQLLYRAAEIAVANGAEGFVVLEEDVERDVRYLATGGGFVPFYAYPYGRFWWGYPNAWPTAYGGGFGLYGPNAYRPVTNYTVYAAVRLWRGQPPAEGIAYRASEVLANLAGKINRPPAGG